MASCEEYQSVASDMRTLATLKLTRTRCLALTEFKTEIHCLLLWAAKRYPKGARKWVQYQGELYFWNSYLLEFGDFIGNDPMPMESVYAELGQVEVRELDDYVPIDLTVAPPPTISIAALLDKKDTPEVPSISSVAQAPNTDVTTNPAICDNGFQTGTRGRLASLATPTTPMSPAISSKNIKRSESDTPLDPDNRDGIRALKHDRQSPPLVSSIEQEVQLQLQLPAVQFTIKSQGQDSMPSPALSLPDRDALPDRDDPVVTQAVGTCDSTNRESIDREHPNVKGMLKVKEPSGQIRTTRLPIAKRGSCQYDTYFTHTDEGVPRFAALISQANGRQAFLGANGRAIRAFQEEVRAQNLFIRIRIEHCTLHDAVSVVYIEPVRFGMRENTVSRKALTELYRLHNMFLTWASLDLQYLPDFTWFAKQYEGGQCGGPRSSPSHLVNRLPPNRDFVPPIHVCPGAEKDLHHSKNRHRGNSINRRNKSPSRGGMDCTGYGGKRRSGSPLRIRACASGAQLSEKPAELIHEMIDSEPSTVGAAAEIYTPANAISSIRMELGTNSYHSDFELDLHTGLPPFAAIVTQTQAENAYQPDFDEFVKRYSNGYWGSPAILSPSHKLVRLPDSIRLSGSGSGGMPYKGRQTSSSHFSHPSGGNSIRRESPSVRGRSRSPQRNTDRYNDSSFVEDCNQLYPREDSDIRGGFRRSNRSRSRSPWRNDYRRNDIRSRSPIQGRRR